MTPPFKRRLLVSSILTLLAPLTALPAELPVPCAAGTCGVGAPDVFVTSGQANYSIAGHVGTIEQLSDRAILNWQQFNVANGSKVVFKQPRDISVALNRIYDQSPSQILGAVTANGQIYLINPNGMIFGENARVNVNTLIASSLDIPDAVFNGAGLAGVINQGGGVAALSAASGPRGDIDVSHGAVLETVDGGRVFIFAPKVVNEGTIMTPGGQTILGASSDKVYLEFSTDPALRGFLVEVSTGGEAVNFGEIIADRGNITMAGLLVRQQGVLSATSSVRENGSIRLLARDGAATQPVQGGNELVARHAGTLTVGVGSTTTVLPDQKSDAAAVDDQVQRPSSIELMGKVIQIDDGAQLVAIGGVISATATESPDHPLQPNTKQNSASLTIGAGVLVDVSGDTSTILPMSRNQVDLDLRSNELADSPLQRGGALQGQKVSVDIRKGTDVANVSQAIAAIPRGIGERLSAGGTVSLASEGTMALEPGSTIDISGGKVNYEGGFIATSKLISNGKVVDISQADPSQTYSAVFTGTTITHSAWGVSEKFEDPTGLANAQFEEGYFEGRDAGSLEISAPALSLGATLEAGTTIGRHQRSPTQPLTSALANGRPYEQLAQRGAVTVSLNMDFDTAADVTLGETSRFADDLLIRPEWIVDSGLGSFALTTYGKFVYGAESNLSLAGGSAFKVTAGSVAMDGTFVSPSGVFRLFSKGREVGNAPLSVGEHALVNVAGWWVNDAPFQRQLGLVPAWIEGGTIELLAGGDFAMQQGSLLDVSGGAHLTETGKLLEGHGGLISLGTRSGLDTLFLPQSGLRGFALHQGGTLRFEANALALYEAAPDSFIQPVLIPAPVDPNPGPPFPELDFFQKVDAAIPSFFLQSRGFENYEFVSNRYGTVVAPGAQLYPMQRNYSLPADVSGRASGSYLADFASVVTLPVEERRPANITLGFDRDFGALASAAVVVMPQALIRTDTGGTIRLESEGSIWERGTLLAPAGDIQLSINAPEAAAFPYVKDQVLWVSNGAALLAPGAFKPAFDPLGRTIGDVLGGGTITLDAEQGFVVTEADSLFDVGGTAQRVDITRSSTELLEPVWVSSDAGSVRIVAAEGGLIDGKFLALNSRAESGANVRGGSFQVTFDPNRRRVPLGQDEVRTPDSFPDGERTLVVTGDVAAPGFAFGDEIPTELLGRAEVSLGGLSQGGFDSVGLTSHELFGILGTIRGADARIRFESNVDAHFERSLTLDAPAIDALTGLTVSLSAPLARVGYDFVGTGRAQPLGTGSSSLTIGADTLDLFGHLDLGGFADATFDATGDIRMRGVVASDIGREYLGSLSIDGDLTLAAGRIYPTTLTQYVIDVLGDVAHSFVVNAHDPSDAPLFSVGGSLAVNAPNIDVGGRLFVPQGELALTATGTLQIRDGAIVATALQDDVSLFGRTQAGIDWIYPFPNGRLQIIDRLPEKAITMNGARVAIEQGASVDLSGGGDVVAYEFVPGPGGSKDFLDVSNAGNAFVILPLKNVSVAPFEPLESAGFPYAADTGVILNGIPGLLSGEYAVLPARYALLPGAYLVTPVADSFDMVPGEVRYGADGVPIVAGRMDVRGTSKADSRWSGFKIQPGSFAEANSEYLKTSANKFFRDRIGDDGLTSRVPDDAGNLIVSATDALVLDGLLRARGAKDGTSGRLDLVADRIAIVSSTDAAVDGYVNLLAPNLNAVDVGSVGIGGVRRDVADGIAVDVRATSVRVATGVELTRPEMLMTAKSDIVVEGGARIAALGESDEPAQTLELTSGAAALAVSTRQLTIERVSGGGIGSLNLLVGSSVEASGSLNVNVAGNASLNGDLSAAGGVFSIESQRLALGDGVALGPETRLGTAALASLGAHQLNLTGRDGLDIYGGVALVAPEISLTAPSLDRASADGSLSVSTDALRLGSSSGYSAGVAPEIAPGGTVSISAQRIDLTNGSMQLRGFDQVAADAHGGIVGEHLQLTATGDVSLSTPLLTTIDGGDVSIAAGGTLSVAATALASNAATIPLALGIGGRVSLSGAQVAVASNVGTHSGVIEVSAESGDVDLTDGAVLDASGVSVQLGDHIAQSAGGRISIEADAGSVNATAASQLNVAGGGDAAKGGSVELLATQGHVDVFGALKGGFDASARVDAGVIDGFSDLNTGFETAGFTGGRSYRVREGDLRVDTGSRVSANRINLTSDTGAVIVDGDLILRGQDASASVSAGAGVKFAGAASVSGAGELTINALGTGSTVEFSDAARIDLRGGPLRIRVRDDESVGTRVTLNPAIVTDSTVLDLVTFVDILDGTFDAGDQAALQATFAARDATLDGLRSALPAGTKLSLSAVVAAPGDLSITDDLELAYWGFHELPGTTTLHERPGSIGFHSGGNLTIAANISDGFADGVFQFADQDFAVKRLLTGPSFGYEFIAGADAASADPFSVRDGMGDVVIGPDVRVRTGAGDVVVRAGNAFKFAASTSRLYTAGESTGTGGFDEAFSTFLLHNAEYPTQGGRIDVDVGGSVIGAKTRQLISQYMVRFGGAFFETQIPTMSGVVFDSFGLEPFAQNIGSFGGGAVRIAAGGDVRDLSVIVPETIQHAGDGQGVFGLDGYTITFTDNSFVRRGSTSLDVSARGDIVGGLYYLGAGDATLSSEGKIVRPSDGPGLLLATDDATFDVSARGDVWLESMFNPTMVPPDSNLQFTEESSYYFTYAHNARLDVSSTAGLLTFGNDVAAITNSVDYSTDRRADRPLDVYPGNISATALTGSVQIARGMTLYPSVGGLELYASQDILGPTTGIFSLYISDSDPALLPNLDRPQVDLTDTVLRLPRNASGDKALIHAAVPVHTGDTIPSVIVAQNGAINAPLLNVSSAEALRVDSRSNIDIGRIEAQNVNAGDITSVVSGGDINIRSQRNAETGQVITNSKVIRVAGGGEVQVIAGRSVDLGSSVGLQTSGNLDNPALPESGADITVLTGALGDPQFGAFIDEYLVQSHVHDAALIAFVEGQLGIQVEDRDAALALFHAQSSELQRSFVLQVFFDEVRASGVAAAELAAQKAPKADVELAYDRGREAIATLFPEGPSYAGDLRLFFSQIASLDGGNIRLVVPGGIVNAGLATTSLSTKQASELGIVAQRSGNIDVFAQGNVLVNQSRVFTLDGGDIDMWSSDGNIDAGRGAKTALSTPGLTAVLGENDSVLRVVPPSISGSGIAAAAGTDGRLPDIVLSTPSGFVDAGDAGIRSPGRLFTTELVNVGNVQVGSLVGAPVGAVTLSADLASVGNSASSAAQDLAQAAASNNEAQQSMTDSASQAALGWLEVFLEGYGDPDKPCDADKDPACRSKTQ